MYEDGGGGFLEKVYGRRRRRRGSCSLDLDLGLGDHVGKCGSRAHILGSLFFFFFWFCMLASDDLFHVVPFVIVIVIVIVVMRLVTVCRLWHSRHQVTPDMTELNVEVSMTTSGES